MTDLFCICGGIPGAYALVACNSGNAVYVVDTQTMQVVDNIRCDSYPVGLAISPDGHRMVVTSQGRERQGGNAVNIFDIVRFDGYDYERAHCNLNTLLRAVLNFFGF